MEVRSLYPPGVLNKTNGRVTNVIAVLEEVDVDALHVTLVQPGSTSERSITPQISKSILVGAPRCDTLETMPWKGLWISIRQPSCCDECSVVIIH